MIDMPSASALNSPASSGAGGSLGGSLSTRPVELEHIDMHFHGSRNLKLMSIIADSSEEGWKRSVCLVHGVEWCVVCSGSVVGMLQVPHASATRRNIGFKPYM